MCCDAGFKSAWARLPYCFSNGSLKRHSLEFYLTTFSESVFSETQKLWRSCFDSKCSKFNIDFKNAAKNWEKFFCFSDNCIWIGILKLSLLRTGYFSWAANVLTSSPKIWHVNKRDLFEHNFLAIDQWIWWGCCDAEFNSVWARLPCCLWKGPMKRVFLDIYLTRFSESVISEIKKLWRSSLDSKCLKFNIDFKKAAKNSENVFCFWDNCIWIGITKLSLLRTGYISSAANVLRSSPMIWHVNKRNFFQLN